MWVQFKDTGEFADLPKEQAAQLIAEGRVLWEKGATVPVVGAGGLPGMVPAEELARTSATVTPTTMSEVERHARREALQSGFGQAQAGAVGFGRGLTIGLSDYVASEIGGDSTREYLQDLKDVHPATSGISEVAGAIAPALITRGGSVALTAGRRAATGGRVGIGTRALALTPAGLSARTGYLAERGVAGLVGSQAGSFGGRMGQRALSYGARGATEGAIFGAGQQLSESALKNQELTAERLLLGAGGRGGALQGALLGGLLGGAVGVASGFGSRAISGGDAKVLGNNETARLLSNSAAADGGSFGQDLAAALNRSGDDMTVGTFGKTARSTFDDLPDVAKRWVSNAFDSSGSVKGSFTRDAAEQAAAAQRALKELEMLARQNPGAFRVRVGRGSVGDITATPGKGNMPLSSAAAIVMDDGLTGRLQAIAREFEPTMFKDGSITSLRKEIGTLNQLDAQGNMDVATLRQRMNDMPAPTGNTQDALLWAKVRKAYNDELVMAYRRGAEEIGDPVRAENYAKLLEVQRGVDWLAGVTGSGPKRGLTDDAFTAVTDVAGGHGPLSVMKNLVASQLQPGFGKALRKLAGIIDPQTAAIRAIQNADAHVAARTKVATDGFLDWLASGKPAAATLPKAYIEASSPKEVKSRAERILDEAKAIKSQPGMVHTAVENMAGPLAYYAPMTYGGITAKYVSAYDYLEGLSPAHGPKHLLSHLDKAPMDDHTADRIMRTVDAMNDPLSVIERLPTGAVTRDELSALRIMAPKVFAEVQQQITEGLAAGQINPDYTGRLSLSVMFDVPTDDSMMPKSIAISQTVYQQRPPQGGSMQGVRDGRGANTPRNIPRQPFDAYVSSRRTRSEAQEGRKPGEGI